MYDDQSAPEREPKRKTSRALAASREAVSKHKYALSFWMFAVFALYMTLFAPPV